MVVALVLATQQPNITLEVIISVSHNNIAPFPTNKLDVFQDG